MYGSGITCVAAGLQPAKVVATSLRPVEIIWMAGTNAHPDAP